MTLEIKPGNWKKTLPILTAMVYARPGCRHKPAHCHMLIVVGDEILGPDGKLSTEGSVAGSRGVVVYAN